MSLKSTKAGAVPIRPGPVASPCSSSPSTTPTHFEPIAYPAQNRPGPRITEVVAGDVDDRNVYVPPGAVVRIELGARKAYDLVGAPARRWASMAARASHIQVVGSNSDATRYFGDELRQCIEWELALLEQAETDERQAVGF